MSSSPTSEPTAEIAPAEITCAAPTPEPTPTQETAIVAPTQSHTPSLRKKALNFARRHALFTACVAIPTLLATLYFGIFASDIYVSESSYVVRSPNKKTSSSGIGAMLGSAGLSGFSSAHDDVHTISEYVLSRDALEQLEQQLKLADSWSNWEIDWLRRFNPLGTDDSHEALYDYYLNRVSVKADPTSSITTLTTSVFDPHQAIQINQLLLKEAERMVNVLNERGRNDLIRFAEKEVKASEEKAKAAALAVSNFRNSQSVVDPERQTQIHFEQISRLHEELIKTKSQLTQLNTFAPDSPHPPALKLRIETLEKEIALETQKITGGENSLASKAAEYERLALERGFADRQLASALASLEEARNEAQRQQLYLETIAKPNLPDEAIFPKRLRGIITTAVLGLVAWGILSMLIAGVREHQY